MRKLFVFIAILLCASSCESYFEEETEVREEIEDSGCFIDDFTPTEYDMELVREICGMILQSARLFDIPEDISANVRDYPDEFWVYIELIRCVSTQDLFGDTISECEEWETFSKKMSDLGIRLD